MVVRSSVAVFKSGTPIVEVDLPCDTAVSQSLQSPENGHEPQFLILLPGQLVEFLSTHMPAGPKETLDNHLPLACHLTPATLEIIRENVQDFLDLT
jgi:hypothetical protein